MSATPAPKLQVVPGVKVQTKLATPSTLNPKQKHLPQQQVAEPQYKKQLCRMKAMNTKPLPRYPPKGLNAPFASIFAAGGISKKDGE